MNTVSFPGLGLSIQINPVALSLFGWPIRWYGVIIATGFLLAVVFCSRRAHQYGITQDEIIDMLLYAVPLCIIGARVYYVLFYLDFYRNGDGSLDFVRMVRIWDGGLAIYGAIIAAILVVFFFCKKRKISFLAFADLGSMGVLIGQLVGRWGNFVNVEAYGGPTNLPWRMGIFDYTADGVYQYMEVHPTFLYESLWNLAGLILLVILVDHQRKFDGQLFWSYMAWYGIGRAMIEGLRTDSLYFFSTGLRVSQVLGLLFFFTGGIMLAIQFFRPHTPEELWVNRRAALEQKKTEQKETEEESGHDPA